MLNNSNEFTRRMLKTPAIRPCESVNPSTLLSSLINLAQTITCNYNSSTIFSNKRNVKEVTRLISNLLMFFVEIRDGSSRFSDTFVLSFSELHFIFQKIEFLLQDCGNEDAKVWMLMKCEFVSDQFRVLVRAVGVALDVLKTERIDVSDEVKELVGLVKRQALGANLGVEEDDKKIFDKVLSILRCFEVGVAPETSDLRCVVEYLGIKKWSHCDQEIKFLESEILLESETTGKKDLGLLSSLMGLMTYFRCVHFVSVGNPTLIKESDESSGCDGEVISSLNSDDFQCPISLEVMLDPVTIATGHTYDRSSILKWFKAGNSTCPKTGKKLICRDLVSNLAMKHLIRQYCLKGGIAMGETKRQNHHKSKTSVAGSMAAEGAIKMVAIFINGKLMSGANEEQKKAAYEIRLLTKSSSFNRSCLVEAGVISNLLNLLCSKDSAKQEDASAALLNLSKYSKTKMILVENGGLELVLDVIKNGLTMEARQHAAGTLFYISSVEEYRILIGEIPWTIPVLMGLLVEGTFRAKKNALVTILGLLMYPDNHWRVLSAGVVPLLLNLLRSLQREDLITDCLAVLASLAENHDGAMAILSAKALHQIVEVFGVSTTRSVKEHCVSLLLYLCINGGADVVRVLVKNQGLMVPLYDLLADGSPRAGRKASSLIRIIHEFDEKSSSGLMNLPLHHRFIHV
ncbi:RING-type E3 ubiquitin transferase [Heracleum sosnowskyi]|uniref:RING-type E3 ubiquitin transferase n=1 Tax=Heracleum sosnowskyi TaxID=360622 RepID=A0AAD8MQM5_9APIA|nr:RING-type E3 ubiquitin transferase [Heracleum sosnowskyi]